MAPPKKKPNVSSDDGAKENEVPTQSTEPKVKKRAIRKKPESYKRYMRRMLKEWDTGIGISPKGIVVMDSFLNDFFDRIAREASRVMNYHKRSPHPTLTHREIQTAVRLLLPGGLAEDAIHKANRALDKYNHSRKKSRAEVQTEVAKEKAATNQK